MVHWVYVLKCEDNRIYVGETTKLFTRWSQHINGTGAKCTQIFGPNSIIGLYNISKNIAFENYKNDNNYTKLLSTFDIDWKEMYRNELTNLDIENYITECFMKKMENNWYKVRGGKYTKLITDNENGYFDFSCVMNPKCKNNTCDDCVCWIYKRKEMLELGLIIGSNPIQMLKLLNIDSFESISLKHDERPNCLCGYPAEINMYNDELYYNCPLKNANKWIEFENLVLEPNCNFYEKYHKEKINDICLLD